MSNSRLFIASKLTPAKIFQLTALSTALALTGCGGGDNANGGGTDYFPVPNDGSEVENEGDVNNQGEAEIKLAISDIAFSYKNNDNIITSNYLPKEGVNAKIQLLDKDGQPVVGAPVTFVGESVAFNVTNGVVLTDANGYAEIGMVPDTTTDNGTYSLTASANYKGNTATSDSKYFTLQGSEDDSGSNIEELSELNIDNIVLYEKNSDTTQESNEIEKNTIETDGATAKVKITDGDGNSLKGVLVTFSGVSVAFDTSNAAVLTNDEGYATINITPATKTDNGSYSLTATAELQELTANSEKYYFSLQDAKNNVDDNKIVDINITDIQLSDRDGGLVQAGNMPMDSATAKVTVTDQKGDLVPSAVVVFSGEAVEFSSSNNTVLTDEKGEATIGIKPTDTTDTGTYFIMAEAQYDEFSKSSKKYYFSLQPLDTKLVNAKASPEQLTSGGSTAISLTTEDKNGNYQNGVTVNFSVDCGTFTEDSVVSSNKGDISTTYNAVDENGKLCEGEKTIIVRTSTGSTESSVKLPITIEEIKSDSVIYTTNSPITLGVQGSGSSSTSSINFTVYANGVPVANQPVRIVKLDSSPNDLQIIRLGNTDPQVIESNSEGVVSVNLYPGTISGPVEIKAELLDAKSIEEVTASTTIKATALSKNVSVAVGRATQDGLSISLGKNILRDDVDGDSTFVTTRVVDRWGNPVPTGTVVSFTAEGGKIDSNCATDSLGNCSVNFYTQNPRSPDGRYSIVAYLEGDKTYIDMNNNNAYDKGTDIIEQNIGDFFRDDNENNEHDSGERIYQKGASGVECDDSYFSSPNTGRYSECNDGLSATIRRQIVIGMGHDTPLLLNLNSMNSYGVHYFQMYGNSTIVNQDGIDFHTMYMPSGTTVSVAATDNTKYKPFGNALVSEDNKKVTITVGGAPPGQLASVELTGKINIGERDNEGKEITRAFSYTTNGYTDDAGTLPITVNKNVFANDNEKIVETKVNVTVADGCEAELVGHTPDDFDSTDARGGNPVADLMPLTPGTSRVIAPFATYGIRVLKCSPGDEVAVTIASGDAEFTRFLILE